MVRGNWQKRVELAQARREDQRARKARKGDRESHRQMASGLMSFLASSADGPSDGSSPKLLHVWVDSDPRKSSSGSGGGGGGGGRAPAQDAGGFDSDDEVDGRKRGKKGNKKQNARRPQQGSAKKAHPRQGLKNSHHFDDDEGESAADAQQLCVRHFFYDKCAGSAAGNKKGGGKGSVFCKLQHMRDPTVALALKKVREAEAVIAASASAAAGDGDDEQAGAAPVTEDAGMSMLWYLSVPLEKEIDEDKSGKGINEILQSHLSRSKLGAATIVYVVLDKRLLYDRNRGGVIEESPDALEEDAEAKDGEKVPRKHGRSRGESMAERKGSMCDGEDSDDANILLHFPESVLESILTYLPDMYTGNLPRICKVWHAAIGQNSPNLWYQLLLRRGLPLPVEKSADGFLLPAGMDAGTAGSPRDVCRDAFVGHYEAFRDLQAVHELFLKLQGQTAHTSSTPTEACAIHYNSSPGAPREGSGRSTSMKIWSEGKVLVAFEEDCTLRLFEAASAGESSLACRQTVSVIVSPEPRSKRGQWEMTGMDIDNQYIGCICQPGGNWDFHGEEGLQDEIKSPVMHIIKREDLLCASGGGSDNRPGELDPDDVLNIDLRDAVCQHLLNDCLGDLLSSAKESDADLVDLIENEERLDLVLHVSSDVVACSRGRFLFKGALLTRDIDPDNEQVSFRAYLYSASARKITWSENVHVSLPFSSPFGRMVGQTKAIASASSAVMSHPSNIRTAKIDVSKDGAVEFYDMPCDSSQLVAITKEKRSWDDYDENVQVEGRNWDVSTYGRYLWRPVLLTSSDVFITCHETFYNAPSGDVKNRTVVTFSVPIESGNGWEGAATEGLTLEGHCRIDDMHPVGSDHVILIGEMFPDEPNGNRATQGGDGDDGNVENENNDIAGEWFGVANDDADEDENVDNEEEDQGRDATDEGGYCISLIHIPSRKEIKRYRMPIDPHFAPFLPLFRFASGCNTIGLEATVTGSGLIMSGRGVRDVVGDNTASSRSDDAAPKSKKKKRQATRAKGRNKDGFARGMSARG
mmetsp:Transcript_25575/g.73952  ORF Transcript_25575/g.73952 Transcript_25575/m.73952 type:complete len:1035 (+) Transcript_25575:34-3138(+)